MIRVGFLAASADSEWVGGTVYLANLLHSIHALPEPRIQPVVIAAPSTPDSLLGMFPSVEIIRTRLLERGTIENFTGRALKKGLDRDVAMVAFLRRHSISVLSHSGHLGARTKFPTVQWIADFQHRRMPEFFSPEELKGRDDGCLKSARTSTVLVLSSADALRDLAAFDKVSVPKSRVMHFVSGFGLLANKEVSAEDLRRHYQFSGPYFHLPNQFWAHKNHMLVVDALAILQKRGIPALVLATGHTRDRRRLGHFEALMAHVKEAGVENTFRVLGLVPYDHLAALMRYSVAIINPSRFEGWSTTVEEAKSLGKTVLLSDIPVHREQAPQWGHYFDTDSPDQMADLMEKTLRDYSPQVDAAHQEQAARELPGRVREFAQTFETIALAACGM